MEKRRSDAQRPIRIVENQNLISLTCAFVDAIFFYITKGKEKNSNGLW